MAGLSDLNQGINVKAVTGTYTVLASDSILVLTPNAASTVVTLPAAASVTGQIFVLNQVKVASDQILVKSTAGTLDATAAATGVVIGAVNTSASMTVFSDGTNYRLLAYDGAVGAH